MDTSSSIVHKNTPCIVVVTGYSGAGKSTVLRALEDIGFFCVDNLPLKLLDSFFNFVFHADFAHKQVALGIDVRGGGSAELIACVHEARMRWPEMIKVVFVTASSAVLLRRFQETRRTHPLAHTVAITAAIEQEKQELRPLIESSDVLFDTDQFTAQQLRAFVRTTFAQDATQLTVHIISFGFKYGAPPESNYVYDVRSLPNPYFVPALRDFSGLDLPVREYLFAQQEVQDYWRRLQDFVQYSIERSYIEGRSFMNIAIGCTGGRHRSVTFAQQLAQQEMEHVRFLLTHRDIKKGVKDEAIIADGIDRCAVD